MVEVLEEPNTGLFGFGAREARVRMILIGKRRAPDPELSDNDVDRDRGSISDENLKDVAEDELGEDAIVGKTGLGRIAGKNAN